MKSSILWEGTYNCHTFLPGHATMNIPHFQDAVSFQVTRKDYTLHLLTHPLPGFVYPHIVYHLAIKRNTLIWGLYSWLDGYDQITLHHITHDTIMAIIEWH